MLEVNKSSSLRLRRLLKQPEFWAAFLGAVSVASFFAALLAYAYVGLSARYIIDDHCVAADLWENGFIGAQKHWYLTSTGRFTLMLVLSVVELIGPGLAPFLPLVALTLWLIGLTWTILQFRLSVGRRYPVVTSLLLSELIIYVTLGSVSNLHQVLYWVGGMLTYVAPLILLTIYVGFIKYSIDRKTKGWGTLFLSGSFTFIAAGFSETNLALQMGVFFLAIMFCSTGATSSFKGAALPLINAGFIGSILAAIVVILAPGSAARQATFPLPPALPSLISDSFLHTLAFVIASTRTRLPLTMSVALLLPALLAFKQPTGEQESLEQSVQLNLKSGRVKWLLLTSTAAALMFVAFCIVPAVYATSAAPLPRTLVIPQFVLVCFTVFWGYLVGSVLKKNFLSSTSKSSYLFIIMVVAMLVLGPITSAWRTFAASPRLQAQAAVWDALERQLHTAQSRGIRNLVVPKMYESEDYDTLSADPNFYVNRCVARYYGLDSIVAK